MIDVSPSRTISIGDTQYALDGSFATLRTLQQHLRQDVIEIVMRVMDMRLDETATLIAIGSGKAADIDAIGQSIIDELGLSTGYVVLKTQLYAWLMIALAPRAEREKKRAQADELIAKALSLSRGPTTSGSPLAPSDGNPASSGAPTSGS